MLVECMISEIDATTPFRRLGIIVALERYILTSEHLCLCLHLTLNQGFLAMDDISSDSPSQGPQRRSIFDNLHSICLASVQQLALVVHKGQG